MARASSPVKAQSNPLAWQVPKRSRAGTPVPRSRATWRRESARRASLSRLSRSGPRAVSVGDTIEGLETPRGVSRWLWLEPGPSAFGFSRAPACPDTDGSGSDLARAGTRNPNRRMGGAEPIAERRNDGLRCALPVLRVGAPCRESARGNKIHGLSASLSAGRRPQPKLDLGDIGNWVSRHLRCLGPRSAHPEVPAPTEHEWSTASMRGPRRASARVAQAVPSPHGPSRAGHEGGGNERGPWARPPQGERERQPEMSGYPAIGIVARASSPVKATTKATRAGTPVPRLMMGGADTFATSNIRVGQCRSVRRSPTALSPDAKISTCSSRDRRTRCLHPDTHVSGFLGSPAIRTDSVEGPGEEPALH